MHHRWSQILTIITALALLMGIIGPVLLEFVWPMSLALQNVTAASWVVFAAAIVARGPMAAIEHGRAVWWMRWASAIGALALLLWLLVIWMPGPMTSVEENLMIAATLASGVFVTGAVIGGLLLVRIDNVAIRRAVHAAIALDALFIAVATVMCMIGVAFESNWSIRDWNRFESISVTLGAVIGAPAVLLTFTTIFLAGRRALMDEGVNETDRLTFQLVCPRCGRTVSLRTEGDQCPSCALGITVKAT